MKTLHKHLKPIVAILLTTTLSASCGQTTNNDLIIGKWQFEKFISEFEGSGISKDEAKMLLDANNVNKGLTLTFTSENKFQSEQNGGLETNNSKGRYSIIGKNVLVIMGDTSRILQLDKNYLKLYSKGRPIVTFKRL